MYENIELAYSNFCVGPQAGTFCSIDTSGATAVLRVKNSTGTLLNSYSFYPDTTLEVDSDFSTYPYNISTAIKYTGPTNQTGYYTNMIFFTMERNIQLVYDPILMYNVPKSNEFILRKWILNATSNRLELEETYTKTGNATNHLDCFNFAIGTIKTYLDAPAAIADLQLTLPTTSGISVNDSVVIGPSTDATNVNAVENCYVFSIDSPTVISIRTVGPTTPPVYEYIAGNPVTIVKDAYTISHSSTTSSGALYTLDAQGSYSIIAKNESNIYDGAIAMDWNSVYGTPTFVKGTELLSIELSDYEISKSHTLKNVTSAKELLTIYDISIEDNTVYRLQDSTQLWSDTGGSSVTTWTTYNFVADTMIPYVASINITHIADSAILTRLAQVFISIKVRDQFGASVRDKNIQFNKSGDSEAAFDPSNGQLTTDVNGEATITYNSGANYNGNVDITVRSDGSSTHLGSQYVWVDLDLTSVVDFDGEVIATQELDITKNIEITQYYLPTSGLWFIQESAITGSYIFEQAFLPYLNDVLWGEIVPSRVDLRQITHYMNNVDVYDEWTSSNYAPTLPETSVTQLDTSSDSGIVDQTYVSRHYSDAHIDTTTLEQFSFISEARPPFWSEKNSTDTDIWLRLRPFATSLDINTLIVKIREVSYAGDTGWVDITSEAAITIYDAGGGLNGLEFQWYITNPFHNNATVYVTLEVKDTAFPPNKVLTDYWFKVIPDFKAPYIDNLYPAIEEFDVAVDTPISFDVHDLGSGVDIDSLDLLLNYTKIVPTTITKVTDNHYQISYTPPKDFYYSSTVSVEVTVADVSSNVNILHDSWRFYTLESTEPWIDTDNFYPGRCVKGLPRNQSNVNFQVYGLGNGIDDESVELYIGGLRREALLTPIVYRLN